MPKQRPTTRRERKAKIPATIPGKFHPRFIESADQRQGVIKLIRRRLERLKEEAGCDSYQKEMLAEQAIFISIQLETMKVNALEGEAFDAGIFTQMVNCLSGLLTKLGLTQHAAKAETLTAILSESRRAVR